MLLLERGATVFHTKIGHYSIHYPDFQIMRTFSERTEIPATELPFLYFEDRSMKAFQISPELAKEWGFAYPVIWVKF